MASKLTASATSSACARALLMTSAWTGALSPWRSAGSTAEPSTPRGPSQTWVDTRSRDSPCCAYSTSAAARAASSSASSAVDAKEVEGAASEGSEALARSPEQSRARRTRPLLIVPEDADSQPTLAVLDRLRPPPFKPPSRRRSAPKSGFDRRVSSAAALEAYERYLNKTATRVAQAFNKSQLVKIAQNEIPIFSQRRRDRRRRGRGGSATQARTERTDSDRVIHAGIPKHELIRRIMHLHWKLPEPKHTEYARAVRLPPQPVDKPDVTVEEQEWTFYPLDIPQLYIVLTSLKMMLTDFAKRHSVRFFPATNEVEAEDEVQKPLADGEATAVEQDDQATTSSDDRIGEGGASESQGRTRVVQGIQIVGKRKEDVEAVHKYLEDLLRTVTKSTVDLGPIYAAAQQAPSTPEELAVHPAMLKVIGLSAFSFIQPSISSNQKAERDPNTSTDVPVLRYHMTAASSGRAADRFRFNTQPVIALRQYAMERRDQAHRPLFVYTPSSTTSGARSVASELGASRISRAEGEGSEPSLKSSRYALHPHRYPTPRPRLVTLHARARIASLSDSDGHGIQAEAGQRLANRAAPRVSLSAALPRWRLEKSSLLDAYEGRGGLGFSLGYGVDLVAGSKDQDSTPHDEDGWEQDELSVEGEPRLLLGPPSKSTSEDQSASAPPSNLFDYLNGTSATVSNSEASPRVHHTYTATFGHFRFESALKAASGSGLQSTTSNSVSALFIPPLPGAWSLGKLKTFLSSNEVQAPSDTSLMERFQRPSFSPALPPSALLPPNSVSNTLSAVKSGGDAAGDAWTRLMARAFGDLSSSIIGTGPGRTVGSRARQAGSVLLEALQWQRSFQRRQGNSKESSSAPAGQAQPSDPTSGAATTTKADEGSKSIYVGKTAGPIEEPEREDIARFTYVPTGAEDRKSAPGRRLVFEAVPIYEPDGHTVHMLDPVRAFWETSSAQADVLVPNAPVDLRMAHEATTSLEPAALLRSPDLRRYLTEIPRDSSERRPMLSCYRHAFAAPEEITLPIDGAVDVGSIANQQGVDTDGAASPAPVNTVRLVLENATVMSRATWPLPPAETPSSRGHPVGIAHQAEASEAAEGLRAFVVEETSYLDGSMGDAITSIRIEWRSSPSASSSEGSPSTHPHWSTFAGDLDLLLDVPYGICRGRSAYTSS